MSIVLIIDYRYVRVGFGDRFLRECANNTVDECYTIKICATPTICGETKVIIIIIVQILDTDCDGYNNYNFYSLFVSDY